MDVFCLKCTGGNKSIIFYSYLINLLVCFVDDQVDCFCPFLLLFLFVFFCPLNVALADPSASFFFVCFVEKDDFGVGLVNDSGEDNDSCERI